MMENISAMDLRQMLYKNSKGQNVLDLKHKKMKTIPEAVLQMSDVEVLNLSHNKLTVLPTGIDQLKNLRELLLSHNSLSVLPESIGNLEKLTRLDVSWNQLTTLPTSLTQLKELQELYLTGNKLTVLPESIGNLKKLTRLDVKCNQLTTLPASIKQLKQLQELYLAGNKLTELPESIGNLEKLTRLNVSNNQLTALPTSITQLKQLKELYLYQNKLTVLPESIGNLKKLTMLNVSNNQLTALPTSITQLKHLEELDLYRNKLTVLPDSIGNLEKLTMLNVSNNQLTVLPESIANLEKLTMLNVSNNQLTAIPASIRLLKQLQELDWIGNELTTLPESIGKLENCTKQDASCHPFTYEEKKVQKRTVESGRDIDDLLSKDEFLQSKQDSLLERDRKSIISSREVHVKEEGDSWELTEAAAFITFPPKAVTEPMEITCSLWSPRTCSPPLGENEALVSNVIEFSCDGLPGLKLSRDFNEGVTLALSHSATDLKGYEVVIQQLMDPENNEWKDLETKNTWSESGFQGDPHIRIDISGLLFPLAVAKVTQCSSFAVVWRLKSFTFSSNTTSLTDAAFTCTVPKYPDVSVAIPRSVLRESGDFSLTIKVQEVPCDKVKDDEVLVGPILHISSSPDVQFLEPVTIKIPFSLREAKKEVLGLSSGQLRILNCRAKYPEWTDITDDLETPADVKDGVVTFQVKHFSKFSTAVSKFKRKLTSSVLQHFVKNPKMPQEAGFLACLCEDGSLSGSQLLTLWCFPLQMQPLVESHITSKYKVHHQGEGNSLKPLCKDDATFISDLEALTPLQERDFKKFPLRFLGDHWSKSDLLVRVGENNVPKVTLNKVQQEDELVCELVIIPTFQAASNIASTSQAQSNVASTSQAQISVPSTSQAQSNVASTSQAQSNVAPTSQAQSNVASTSQAQSNVASTSHAELNVPSTSQAQSNVVSTSQAESNVVSTSQAESNIAFTSQAQSNVVSTSQTELNVPSTSQAQSNVPSSSDRKLKVTLLADEWGSSKGGLSTMNRELAIHLAKHPRVEVTFLLPHHCSDRDKEEACQHNISIVKAEEKAGFEPQDWLIFPPTDLTIDIVIGHGVKLGRQAQIIRDSHKCKWVQVVHTAPEDLGMYKSYSDAIPKAEEKHQTEVEVCKLANCVVTIGPKLYEEYRSYLRPFKKNQDVFQLTPGIFSEFSDLEQASEDGTIFRVLLFGRGDPEDFELKGYDIAAQAVASLESESYRLVFVGAPEGKQEEVKENFHLNGISLQQLRVRSFVKSRQELRNLFCEMDLAIMPSRTEGFGLTALEALSAGLPVLSSKNSGFGQALKKVPSGSLYVVESEGASDWAKAIQCVRNKNRELRLKEVKILRKHYEEDYSWEKLCDLLVKKMWNLADGSS